MALTRAFLGIDEPEKAILEVQKALNLEIEGGQSYLVRGVAYAIMDKFSLAQGEFALAVKLSPEPAPTVKSIQDKLP